MNELAQAFFHKYRQRLSNGLPQQSSPARKTFLERAVEAYQRGDLIETEAIERVEREGFTDVVPRVHTINRDQIPLRFYEATPTGLVLTEALLATVQGRSHRRPGGGAPNKLAGHHMQHQSEWTCQRGCLSSQGSM